MPRVRLSIVRRRRRVPNLILAAALVIAAQAGGVSVLAAPQTAIASFALTGVITYTSPAVTSCAAAPGGAAEAGVSLAGSAAGVGTNPWMGQLQISVGGNPDRYIPSLDLYIPQPVVIDGTRPYPAAETSLLSMSAPSGWGCGIAAQRNDAWLMSGQLNYIFLPPGVNTWVGLSCSLSDPLSHTGPALIGGTSTGGGGDTCTVTGEGSGSYPASTEWIGTWAPLTLDPNGNVMQAAIAATLSIRLNGLPVT